MYLKSLSADRFFVLGRVTLLFVVHSTRRAWHMAPKLAASQHELIRDMITDGASSYSKIAEAAECSAGAVKAIRKPSLFW